MNVAIVLFAVAALGGLYMAVLRFRGAERPPTAIALVHGALAADRPAPARLTACRHTLNWRSVDSRGST